jgi:hypothetical protein
LANLTTLVMQLEGRVQDNEFPLSNYDYEAEIEASAVSLGYEDITELPKKLESLVILKSQLNFYYLLAGKHAKNYRVRIEGDMEIHSNQVAENYLKLATKLEDRLDKEMERLTDSIEMIESTRYRVSTIGNVPRSTGGDY